MPVEGERFNVQATASRAAASLRFSSRRTWTPFLRSSLLRKMRRRIYGRGSCDAKGIIAAQVAAAERLRQQGIYVGLLFVVGEERDSLGAQARMKAENPSPRHAKISGQRRAHGKSHCARVERHAPRGSDCEGTHGAFRVSGARRVRNRQIDSCAHSIARDAVALRSRGWPVHAEHWPDRRRARAQRDSRLRPRGFALQARRPVGRIAPARFSRPRASRCMSLFRSNFPFCDCAPSTDCRP